MKSKNNKKPRAIDGFVPRRLGDVPGTMGQKRRTLNDFESSRSKEAIEFHEAKDDTGKEEGSIINISPEELGSTDFSNNKKSNNKKKRWNPFSRNNNKPPLTRKQKVKRIALGLMVLLVIFGGLFGWKFLRNTGKIFGGNVFGIFDNTKLRGEEVGRVNILLAGTSEGDPGHDGADLTDSIMIVSIDTKNNTAFTVSIPRDTWVDYGAACASGYAGKINVAYQCGKDTNFKEAGYPDGGMGLLSKIVNDNFGIKANYYGKINYKAFEDAVKAVGGIDINLKTDDDRGILDRIFDWECNYNCYKVKYPNGKLHLNGEQALDLARARGDYTGYPTYGTGNDFGRTTRQREMLVALKDKILSSGTLINPAKISSLLDAAGKNVKTDFKVNELRRLYAISKLVDSSKIESIDLASEKVGLLTTDMYSGQSIVLPTAGMNDFSQIKAFFKKKMSTNPVVKEEAKIVVLNGSGVAGLAQTKADELTKKDLTVISVGNGTSRKDTVVIDKTAGKKSATSKLLGEIFGVTPSTSAQNYPDAKKYEADFIVIVGSKQ